MSTIEKDKALVVPEPYAVYIVKGLKTMLVSSNDYSEYIDKEILLAGHRIYGSITLYNQRLITKDDFDRARNVHKLSETEYLDRGWDEEGIVLYAYDFKFVEFDEPRDIDQMAKSHGDIWDLSPFPEPVDVEEEPMEFTSAPPDDIEPTVVENDDQSDELKKELEKAEHIIKIYKELTRDLIFKPKGPWGEGFNECEKYVREKHPDIEDPVGYCAAIYHDQTKKETAEGIVETPTGWVIKIHKVPEEGEYEVSTVNETRATIVRTTSEYEDYRVESSYITEIKINKDQCPDCIDIDVFRDYNTMTITSINKILTISEIETKIAELQARYRKLQEIIDESYASQSPQEATPEDKKRAKLYAEREQIDRELDSWTEMKVEMETFE